MKDELTVKQLLEYCLDNGRTVGVFWDGEILEINKKSGQGPNTNHNIETLTETILGAQSDPVPEHCDCDGCTDGDDWPEERVDVIGQNGNDGLHYLPSTDVVPGYECLADVLQRALDQASRGKGKERHAQDMPFDQQPMQRLISLYGPGFALGQAAKKAQESQRLPRDMAVAELLGAINYLAGAIIHLEQVADHG